MGQLGNYHVAEKFYTFTEPANALHGSRVLQVTVHFPVIPRTLVSTRPAGGTFPLVVFAPGFKQCGYAYPTRPNQTCRTSRPTWPM